jgi:hypothetical protein
MNDGYQTAGFALNHSEAMSHPGFYLRREGSRIKLVFE